MICNRVIKGIPVVVMLIGCALGVRAEVWKVGGESKLQSVTEAIAAANAGDTIEVAAGTYVEQVVLGKRLVLAGVGHPVLRGTGRGSVITATADGCVVRGFIVEHSGSDLQQEDSGILLQSSNNHVEDNEIRDVLYGVYLYHSQGNSIRRNVIQGRSELEVGERGAGLHLWNSPDNTIEENTISFARDGMYIQSSPGNYIRANRVSNLRYGLHYMSSDRNRFEDNVFSNNIAGAAIMYSNGIEFRRNAFTHNRGFSSFGILFQDCEGCLAEENFIVDNATGVFMEALRKSTFRNNVIAENDVAVQMFSSASGNLFSGNNFVDNISPLQLIGRGGLTQWAEGGRGNYWSDYDGYDLGGDGLGDVPHKVQNVFEYMEGNHPRLRLYLYSAAAQALATAEKSFPILRGSSEADPAPLIRPSEVSFAQKETRPMHAAQILVGLLSIVMCGASVVVIWKGQRAARASVAGAE